MEKVLEFLGNNSAILGIVIGGLVGLFLPAPKFFQFGKKLNGKIPDSVVKIFNDRIDAFQDGLVNVEHEGRGDIISNEQLKKEANKLKKEIKLGK